MSAPTTRALLYDPAGLYVTERRVLGPPEYLEHDGRRYELVGEGDGWVRYVREAK